MKIILINLLFLMLATNCKAQDNSKKTTMKTFDIETFEKNKNSLEEYSFVAKDSSFVTQSTWHSGYEETLIPKDSYIFKYYDSGQLKLSGDFFSKDFEKGVWKEYGEDGTLLKETDYDKPYKYTWEDILAFIKKRKVDMNAYGFEVFRSFNFGKQVEDTKNPFWAVTYNKNEEDMLLGVIILDGITGEMIKEYDQPYPSEE